MRSTALRGTEPVSQESPVSPFADPAASGAGARGVELVLLAGALVLANLHLVVDVEPLSFLPRRFAEGEWLRLVAHPFVHVTAYHLALDGVAFLALWATLRAPSRGVRLVFLGASAMGALGLALLVDPRVRDIGFCGLSGVAHGLMAIVGLEMIAERTVSGSTRATGVAIVALVTAKCAYELAAGGVFFERLQLGLTGTPIESSHAGGVLGGAIAWATCEWIGREGKRGRRETSRGAIRLPGSAT